MGFLHRVSFRKTAFSHTHLFYYFNNFYNWNSELKFQMPRKAMQDLQKIPRSTRRNRDESHTTADATSNGFMEYEGKNEPFTGPSKKNTALRKGPKQKMDEVEQSANNHINNNKVVLKKFSIILDKRDVLQSNTKDEGTVAGTSTRGTKGAKPNDPGDQKGKEDQTLQTKEKGKAVASARGRGRKQAKINNPEDQDKYEEGKKDEEVALCISSKGGEKSKEVAGVKGKGTKRTKPCDPEDQKETAKKTCYESSDKSEEPTEVQNVESTSNSKFAKGDAWNFKIASWNINGIRAWLQKGGMDYLKSENPDIMCVQETKCSDAKLPETLKNIDGYHAYWLSGDKDGYSGVGLLSKEEPLDVKYGIGFEEHDKEGRVITAEYEKFILVAAYVPNAGRGLVRLDYRTKWDQDFRQFLKKLDEKKPVVLCGDLNVAHQEIDLANPKTNKKNAGFTKEEREGFTNLLEQGFIDTFRYFHPDVKGAYTFWTYMMNARGKNVGWRLDYFVVSKRFDDKLCDSIIHKDVMGSDHCPIALLLSL